MESNVEKDLPATMPTIKVNYENHTKIEKIPV